MTGSSSGSGNRSAFVLSIIVLLALQSVLFYRVVFLGESFFYRDVFSFHYPMKVEVAAQWARGTLPVWNDHHAAGQPMLANPNYSVLSPFNVPFFFLTPERAFSLAIVTAFTTGSLGVLFLARHLGLHPAAALMASIFFSLSGPICSLGNLFNAAGAAGLMPWVFLFALKTVEAPSLPGSGALGALGALQLFCGEPVLSLLTAGGVAWVCLVHLAGPGPSRAGRVRVAGFLACALVLGLVASAAQWLPTLELLKHSARGTGYSVEGSSIWSFHPLRTLEFLVPGVFGRPTAPEAGGFWGGRLGDKGLFYLVGAYFGVAFPLAAGFSRGKRFTVAWAGGALAALVLALGKYLPIYGFLLTLCPPLRIVRYPEKFLVLVALFTAVAGGAGLSRIIEDGSGSRVRARAGALFALGGGVFLSLAVFLRLPAGARSAKGLFVQLSANALTPAQSGQALISVSWSAARTGVFALILAVLLGGLLRRFVSRRAVVTLIVVVLVADLLPVSININPTVEAGRVQMEPVFAARIRSLSGGRFYARYDTQSVFPQLLESAKAQSPYIWMAQGLGMHNCSWPSRLSTSFSDDVDGLLVQQTHDAAARLMETPPGQSTALLKAAGARFVATSYRMPPEGFELIEDYSPAGWPIRLYEVRNGCGEVQCVDRARPARDSAHALSMLAEGSIDPCKEVAVPDSLELPPAPVGTGLVAAFTPRRAEAGTVEIEIESAHPCFIVNASTFYPGWKVTIDGKEGELVRANGAYMAAYVDAGKHAVIFRFASSTVRIGCLTSLFGVGLIAVLIILHGVRPVRRFRKIAGVW